MSKSILLQNDYNVKIDKDIEVSYEVISSVNLFEGYGEIEEFGIKVIQFENNIKKEIDIKGISTNEQEVVNLIEKFVEGSVTILTVYDIVEDYILEKLI